MMEETIQMRRHHFRDLWTKYLLMTHVYFEDTFVFTDDGRCNTKCLLDSKCAGIISEIYEQNIFL